MNRATETPRRPARRQAPRERFDPYGELDDGWDEEEVYEEYEPYRPGGARVVKVFVALLVFAGALLGGLVWWASRQIDPPGEQGAQLAKVTVPKGAGLDQVASILEKDGVIANAWLFGYYARWQGLASWKAGDYVVFRKNSTYDEAMAVLEKGPLPPRSSSITIPPGMRLTDALARIAKQVPTLSVDQLNAALASGQVKSKYHPAGESWEGYLAPDTYEVGENPTAVGVLQKLVTTQDKRMDGLGYARAQALTGRSTADLVKIASMVEAEAGTPAEEKGKIARVIFNRLDKDEILGIDAVIAYGLGKTGSLTKKDLETDSPYNNRRNKGLPPTAIALPSEASLMAAISPPDGNWIYYVLVSNDPPSHLFTASAKEFQQAKEKAQAEGVF